MEVTGNCRFENIVLYNFLPLCNGPLAMQDCKCLFRTSFFSYSSLLFFFFFYIAPWPQAIFQFSATELNPGGHICHLWVSFSAVTVLLMDSAYFHLMIELELSLPAACSAWLKKWPWKLLKGSGQGWPEEALWLAVCLFLWNSSSYVYFRPTASEEILNLPPPQTPPSR